ncbi:phage tail tape measure protein [Shewanella sp. SM21]|uniref:phage tail tape measure protein n=1 Tax=Shewanella sp. SM21 TaxID=2912793 RepID=UPI0021D8FFF2|nr:phage tail tape measure protein [Shewanella sp. SM21]MCU8086889.1 phage tail tape measure protein [Shewanella sp. SM21]
MGDTNKKTSIILSAVNRFSGPTDDATKSVGKLRSAATETSAQLKELGDKQKLITRFKSLSEQLDETGLKLAAAKAHTKQLQQAEVTGAEATKKHAAELKAAERTTAQLTSAYGRQARELGGLRSDLGAAGLKVNALGAEELRLAKQTTAANKALAQQSAKLKHIQTLQGRIDARNAQKGELVGQAVGVAAAAAPMVMAGKRSIEYESKFADVKKVVNFSSEKEEADYRRQMMKMAGDLGVKQDGIADIVTAAGQSGIEKDQLLQFAESATKMSVAWDVSAEEAGSTLATWRAAMGLTQKNALDLADATNYLSNNMNAKAKDIAAVMVRQGSTAMGAGFSYNDTAALSASLIAGGATEETAATALKNISGALTAGYSATGSQKQALGKLGFDPEELASAMQQDAKGTLLGVLRELQDVSADERGAVISQLFGSEIKGAVSKLVTTMDDDKNGVIAAFGRVAKEADRAGSVNDEYANRSKTRGHLLAQLSGKFDRMVITLGDRLLPVLDAVVPPLMTVVDAVSDFAEANPKLATGLLGVAAAIAVVKAGAIAFKLAKLTMGNGLDRFKLGKTKLSSSTDETTTSANRASRALDRLNRKLGGLGAGSGGYGRQGRTRRGAARPSGRLGRMRGGASRLTGGIGDLLGGFMPEPALAGSNAPGRRPGRAGRFGRMAGLLGGGAALSMVSGAASAGDLAMAGADIAGAAGSVMDMLPAGGALLKGAGKIFKPADILLQGAGLASAISGGDSKQIGGTAGDMVGGMGGAAAGAMAGAALGSVVPIVGTAIGGIIGSIVGGLGGGAVGEWAGTKIGGWFSEDKTDQPAPAAVAQQTKQLEQSNKTITFSPTIQITPSGNPAYDRDVGNDLMARMKAELSPMLLGNSDVSARADSSLSDRSDT